MPEQSDDASDVAIWVTMVTSGVDSTASFVTSLSVSAPSVSVAS